MQNLDEVSSSDPRKFWEQINRLGLRAKFKIPSDVEREDGTLGSNPAEVAEKMAI